MKKAVQPNLFHLAPKPDSPSVREMLRRNGGVREVAIIRYRNARAVERLSEAHKSSVAAPSPIVYPSKRMP